MGRGSIDGLLDAKVPPMSVATLKDFVRQKAAQREAGDGGAVPDNALLHDNLQAAEAKVAECSAAVAALNGGAAPAPLVAQAAEARAAAVKARQALAISEAKHDDGQRAPPVDELVGTPSARSAALKAVMATEGGLQEVVGGLFRLMESKSGDKAAPDGEEEETADDDGALPYERECARRLRCMEKRIYLDPVSCDETSDDYLRFKAELKRAVGKTKTGVMMSTKEYRLPDTSQNFNPVRVKQGFRRMIDLSRVFNHVCPCYECRAIVCIH